MQGDWQVTGSVFKKEDSGCCLMMVGSQGTRQLKILTPRERSAESRTQPALVGNRASLPGEAGGPRRKHSPHR